MKLRKPKISDYIFLVIIALLIIPQTRQPIQIAFHSILSQFGPSVIDKGDRKKVSYTTWKLEDLNGNTLDFSDTKNKVVFINLWATWCPPCIAEFHTIQDLYDDYNEKVVFLLISNESPSVIRKFLDKKGYDIQVYRPLTNYPEVFNSRSIPRSYILDKEGNIVVDKKGAANWNSDKVRNELEGLLIK